VVVSPSPEALQALNLSTPSVIQLNPTVRLAAPVDQHKREVILFGGVDNSDDTSSIFVDSFVSAASAFKASNWNVQILYGNQKNCANCDSPFSIDPIAAAAGLSSSQIPKASIEQLEAKLDDSIAKLGQGDELLLEINTHGVTGVNSAGEPTVSLAVYDESDPSGALNNRFENGHQHGSMLIDDPALTQRLQTLKDNGVKIAISNDACFGGAAVLRLKQYGCILSQTSGKYGLGSPVSDSYVSALTASAIFFSTLCHVGRSELIPLTIKRRTPVFSSRSIRAQSISTTPLIIYQVRGFFISRPTT